MATGGRPGSSLAHMSPAAQRLASGKLGIRLNLANLCTSKKIITISILLKLRLGTDQMLQSSYTPVRSKSTRSTPTPTRISTTPRWLHFNSVIFIFNFEYPNIQIQINPNPHTYLHYSKVRGGPKYSLMQTRPVRFYVCPMLNGGSARPYFVSVFAWSLIWFQVSKPYILTNPSSKRSSAEKRTPVVGGSRGITDNLLNIGKSKKQHNVLSTDNLLNIGSRWILKWVW